MTGAFNLTVQLRQLHEPIHRRPVHPHEAASLCLPWRHYLLNGYTVPRKYKIEHSALILTGISSEWLCSRAQRLLRRVK